MSTGIDWFFGDGLGAHPGLVDAVARGQLSFGYIRADFSTSEDNYGTVTSPIKASGMLKQIEDAGMVAGAYSMLDYRANAAPARDQVNAYADAALLGPGRFPPIFDLELGGGGLAGTGRGSVAVARAGIATFLSEALEAAEAIWPGVAKVIYSSERVVDSDDADTLAGAADHALADVDWFLARYSFGAHGDANAEIKAETGLPNPPVPKAAGDADNFWDHQFAGDAWKLAGLPQVDLNRWHMLIPSSPNGVRKMRALARLRTALGAAATGDFATDLAAFQRLYISAVPDSILGPRSYAKLAWYARAA